MSAPNRFRVFQFEADTVIHDALGPAIGVREKFYNVSAATQKGSVEREIFFDPISADAIALHRAGGWQRAGLADGFVIGKSFDVSAGGRMKKKFTGDGWS